MCSAESLFRFLPFIATIGFLFVPEHPLSHEDHQAGMWLKPADPTVLLPRLLEGSQSKTLTSASHFRTQDWETVRLLKLS